MPSKNTVELSKSDIRALMRAAGMSTAVQPARAFEREISATYDDLAFMRGVDVDSFQPLPGRVVRD